MSIEGAVGGLGLVPRAWWRRLWRRFQIWRGAVLPSRDTHFAVLVADLDGDDDGRQTRHVRNAFKGERGFDVNMIGRKLVLQDLGSQTEALLTAERRGLRWLRELDGDVLIWGEVDPGGASLHLRFLGRQGAMITAADGLAADRRPGSYQLAATGLPLDFNKDFNFVLLALVATAVAPATERQGHYLVEVLEPVAGRLKHLCKDMPAGLDADRRGAMWHSLGLAVSTLGEQSGESHWLEEAVGAYRATLEIYTRERAPLGWAITQNDLGTALHTLGEREADTARLEEAIGAIARRWRS